MSISIKTNAQEYQATWYTDEDGLPQNSIKDIARDKFGYIWLATENGIVRYDGQSFKISTIEGIKSHRLLNFNKSISKDSIIVYNDDYDPILINNRNISKLNPEDKRFYYNEDVIWKLQLNKSEIKHYGLDKVKAISSNGTKVSVKDINDGKLTNIFYNKVAEQLFVHKDNTLYLQKTINGKFELVEIIKDLSFDSLSINCIYYDKELNIIYLGSSYKGFCVIKINKFKSYTANQNSVEDDSYYGQLLYSDNRIFTSNGNIFSTDGFIKKIPFSTDNDKLNIIADHNNNIWITYFETLYRFNHHENKTSVFHSNEKVKILSKKSENQLWAGTEDKSPGKNRKGNLYYIDVDQENIELIPVSKGILPSITVFEKKNDSTFWIGTVKGLYTINTNSFKITKVKEVKDIYIRALMTNKHGLWISSYDNGFMLLRNNVVTEFPLDKKEYLITTHCIIDDSFGYFWITTNKGLFQVLINDLIRYADGKNSNIYYHYYNKSAGLAINEFNGGCSPCGILMPSKHISFPSLNGMVIFNPKNINPITPSGPFYLDQIKINGKISNINDTIYLNRNFNRIDLTYNIPYFENPYNLNIEAKLEGVKNYDWVSLQNNTISFTSLPPGEYTLIARKLSGFGSQYDYVRTLIIIPPAFWQTSWFLLLVIVLIHVTIYLGITLKTKYIRTRNKLLEEKVEEHTFLLKGTISKLRETEDNLNDQMAQYKKLLATITHDIKNPLRYMSLTAQHAAEAYENKNEDITESLESMKSSSFHIYQFVETLLEYSKAYLNQQEAKITFCNLHEIIEEKSKLFNSISKSQKTEIINDVPKTLDIRTNKPFITVIIHNLLDNALKNTYDGEVIFDAYTLKDAVVFTISDSGKGMSNYLVNHYQTLLDAKKSFINKNKETGGIGLSIVIELVLMLNIDMKINSIKGKGTTVTLTFKNSNQNN